MIGVLVLALVLMSILYAISRAKKAAAARVASAIAQSMPSVQTSGGVSVRVRSLDGTTRIGKTTVVVTRGETTATMADGSPLTPEAQAVMERLAQRPEAVLSAERMADVRTALEANGMGGMAAMVERQMAHAFNGFAAPATGEDAEVKDASRRSDDPSTSNPFAPNGVADDSSRPAASPAPAQVQPSSPFDAPAFSSTNDPFGPANDPFSAPSVFAEPARGGSNSPDRSAETFGSNGADRR